MRRSIDVSLATLAGLTIFARLGYLQFPLLSGLLSEENVAKPEIVISAASAVMASAAVAATLWQGFLARQHNRKSVTPHLRVDSGVDDTGDSDGGVIVRKSNRGVGPAIIHRTECIVDGAAPETYGGRGLCAAITAIGLATYHYTYSVPVAGEFMGVGESSSLMKFDYVNDTVQSEITAQLSRLTIHIVYECIYGKTYCVMHTPFAWERQEPAVRRQPTCTVQHAGLAATTS